jgi:hypothetical protein
VDIKGITIMLARWDHDFSTDLILKAERPQPKMPAKRQPAAVTTSSSSSLSATSPVFTPSSDAVSPAEKPLPSPGLLAPPGDNVVAPQPSPVSPAPQSLLNSYI